MVSVSQFLLLLTLLLKLENLRSSAKNLQSNLYQLKKKHQQQQHQTHNYSNNNKKCFKKIMSNKH